MFDIKAAMSDPCQVCRAIVLVLVVASMAQPLQLEDADIFHLRAQFGSVPPAADIVIMMALALATWVVCERVVVGRLLGGCSGDGGAAEGRAHP